jgi:hypothetical protein
MMIMGITSGSAFFVHSLENAPRVHTTLDIMDSFSTIIGKIMLGSIFGYFYPLTAPLWLLVRFLMTKKNILGKLLSNSEKSDE